MNTDVVQIDLTKYPKLQHMLIVNPVKFKATMQDLIMKAEHKLEKEYDEKCLAIFHMTQDELADQLIAAMFDYKGILKHHSSKAEAEAMALLEMENNPLAATQFFTLDGTPQTKEQFMANKLNVKTWFQSLLYAGRYLSHLDLVKYLMLSDIHFVENMQNEHIAKLLAIQPALKYQSKKGIRVGTLIEDTGFYFVGFKIKVKDNNECPVCASKNLYVHTFHQMHYCMDCKAAFPFE